MEKEVKPYLKNEVVKIEPLRRARMNVDEKHQAAFLVDGCENGFYACLYDPLEKRSFDPLGHLSRDQVRDLEENLGLVSGSLNYLSQDNAFIRRRVGLDSRTKKFDLSKYDEYLDYYILLSNKGSICSNYDQKDSFSTFLYVVVSDAEMSDKQMVKRSRKNEVLKFYLEMYEKPSKIVDCLTLYFFEKGQSKEINPKASLNELQTLLDTVVERDGSSFMDICTVEDFKDRVLLAKAVIVRYIKLERGKFFFEGEKTYFAESLQEALRHICNPKNVGLYSKVDKDVDKRYKERFKA